MTFFNVTVFVLALTIFAACGTQDSPANSAGSQDLETLSPQMPEAGNAEPVDIAVPAPGDYICSVVHYDTSGPGPYSEPAAQRFVVRATSEYGELTAAGFRFQVVKRPDALALFASKDGYSTEAFAYSAQPPALQLRFAQPQHELNFTCVRQ